MQLSVISHKNTNNLFHVRNFVQFKMPRKFCYYDSRPDQNVPPTSCRKKYMFPC